MEIPTTNEDDDPRSRIQGRKMNNASPPSLVELVSMVSIVYQCIFVVDAVCNVAHVFVCNLCYV